MRLTTTLDPNHKYWDCRKPIGGGENCNTANDVNEKKCRLCGYKIDGTMRIMAVDENKKIIGELHSVDSQTGEMTWEYGDF
ncbi:hypothetical protein BFJ63_vAg12198 [Fusarium oxysporum f. sp. narcissi]|uniref:Uncharacterized protein n=1 Tax=Fusarium oxysporum f. sp. narcissi TaxID=451672 RepID=A0A4V1RZF7_FUSOX|nr:hypothetical protein BFJ63_vAg12198 [Fusarium oxysporum f. sp. narcissi]